MKFKYDPMSNREYTKLTKGKVYGVIEYIRDPINRNDDMIRILNDDGVKDTFFIYSHDGDSDFFDVTAEYRDEVIDEILNER